MVLADRCNERMLIVADMDRSDEKRRVKSCKIGQIGLGRVMDPNLIATSCQSRGRELRQFSRMSFSRAEKNKNAHRSLTFSRWHTFAGTCRISWR